MRIIHLMAAMPLACLCSTGAFAQAPCGGLKLLEEVQMESKGPGPSTVPVQINDQPVSLTFSTSGGVTQISRDTATSLKLDISQGDTGLFDATGKVWRDRVAVKTFAVGRIQKANMNMPVSPSPAVRGGLFSLNFMLPFDVDADFGSNKLRFFSQDHCPGGVMYWQAPVTGAAPITIEATRITVPAILDGKPIKAVIDTGAIGTSVSTTVAQQILGLTLGSSDTPASTGGFGGPSYSHTFGVLNIGNVPVKDVKVRISSQGRRDTGDGAAAAANRAAVARADMADPVLTVGMDVLRQLHIYLAFKEDKIYLSQTSAPAPAQPAGAAKSP